MNAALRIPWSSSIPYVGWRWLVVKKWGRATWWSDECWPARCLLWQCTKAAFIARRPIPICINVKHRALCMHQLVCLLADCKSLPLVLAWCEMRNATSNLAILDVIVTRFWCCMLCTKWMITSRVSFPLLPTVPESDSETDAPSLSKQPPALTVSVSRCSPLFPRSVRCVTEWLLLYHYVDRYSLREKSLQVFLLYSITQRDNNRKKRSRKLEFVFPRELLGIHTAKTRKTISHE